MKAEQMHPDDLPPLYYRDRDIALICLGLVIVTPDYPGAWDAIMWVIGTLIATVGGFGRGATRHEARKREFIRSNPDAGRYLR